MTHRYIGHGTYRTLEAEEPRLGARQVSPLTPRPEMGGSRVSTRSTTRNGEQEQVPGLLALKGGKHGKPRVGLYSEVEPYAQTDRPSIPNSFPTLRRTLPAWNLGPGNWETPRPGPQRQRGRWEWSGLVPRLREGS